MSATVAGAAVEKYLARHAEPEAAAAANVTGSFGHVLIVPSYGEEDSLLRLIGSIPQGPAGGVLIAVVLNARADSAEPVHAANEALRRRLARELSSGAEISHDPRIRAHPLPGGTLLLVDRATPGSFLPAGQGVGLARKIGCDLALGAGAAGKIASGWIHSTDADTVLPGDYFERTAVAPEPGVSVAIYPFEHEFASDVPLGTAARLYEISLRYYVLGLAWARSPYAYESMGSCLAISAAAYAAVRGFPRRNALEDFYALNKLAKVGRVLRLPGAPLTLEGRISERVPISTGKALSDLVSRPRGLSEFRLYHPAVFAHLAVWLRVLSSIARSGGDLESAVRRLPSNNPFFRADLLQRALEELGVAAAVREATRKSRDERTLLRHLNTWFDAFRTLKLVHRLRAGIPSLPYRQALAEAPFTNLSSSTEEDVEKLRRAIVKEERNLEGKYAGLGDDFGLRT